MAKPLLPDELWERIEPLLPPEPPKPQGGRPRVSNRAAPTGILYVLRTGTPWEYVPMEMGCGSGMTCWRQLRDGQAAGVWKKIWQTLLDELGEADAIGEEKGSILPASARLPNSDRRMPLRSWLRPIRLRVVSCDNIAALTATSASPAPCIV